MNNVEKLIADLERLRAHSRDAVTRNVLAHLIEIVPEEFEFHEELLAAKGVSEQERAPAE